MGTAPIIPAQAQVDRAAHLLHPEAKGGQRSEPAKRLVGILSAGYGVLETAKQAPDSSAMPRIQPHVRELDFIRRQLRTNSHSEATVGTVLS